MTQAQVNGIAIEYELSGSIHAPVLLLIHGVGAQLVRWPPDLLAQFEAAGFRILRFDNRDIGLSSHMDGASVPEIAEIVETRRQGREPKLPYTLADMAADTFGLLDTLGIGEVHVLGVSLGGMIAQVMAISNPQRILSLNLFMTQSGNPDLPLSRPEAIAILSQRAPNPIDSHEGYLAHQVSLNRALGSPAYPALEEDLRRYAALAAERAWNPAGPARQLAAARGAEDRRAKLRLLSVPTLVVHGVDDPLIAVESGAELARCIPGAWLLEINGMGHDLPTQMFELFVSTVRANCARA